MTIEELRDVAWGGDGVVTGPIRGVVLSFHGLGAPALKDTPSTDDLAWGGAGGLPVFPYYGPWSWMNREARALVDGMPDIPYFVVHGAQDRSVAKARHADPFVAAMRQRGRTVRYMEVPGMGHGSAVPLAVIRAQIDFVLAALGRGAAG